MKTIHTNLATFEYIDRRLSLVLMLSAGVLILSISVALIHQFFNDAESIRSYETKILEKEQQINSKSKSGNDRHKTFTKEQQKEINDRIIMINRMIATDVFPWNRILEDLERGIPEGLYLESFVPGEDLSTITLKGLADAESKVSFFYKRLEENKIFRNNTLMAFQVKPKNNSAGGTALGTDIQFTIESRLSATDIFNDPYYHGIGRILIRE